MKKTLLAALAAFQMTFMTFMTFVAIAQYQPSVASSAYSARAEVIHSTIG